jgi:hypothetical protein
MREVSLYTSTGGEQHGDEKSNMRLLVPYKEGGNARCRGFRRARTLFVRLRGRDETC